MISKKQIEAARSIAVSRTKEGVTTKIYGSQVSHSKANGRPLPTYTSKWFRQWLFNNPEFHRLFDMWVISGYDIWLKPSVDRKDEALGYTEYNIELVQWQDNHLKEAIRQSKEVIQLDIDGTFIAEYKSISEASKQTKIPSGNISKVCHLKRKTTAGFRWKFK